jgi:Na+/proline symporter
MLPELLCSTFLLLLLLPGGGFLLMLQLWMAVTATANSEQLAVASLIAYDVYRWV